MVTTWWTDNAPDNPDGWADFLIEGEIDESTARRFLKNAMARRRRSAKKEAESKKAEMMENAKNEVDNMILNGKKVLESEKAKIIEDAKKEIVSLVVLATEKLLESHPNDKFEDKSVNQLKNL